MNEIKKYSNIFVLCFIYFLICYFVELYAPRDDIASVGEVLFIITFPPFSGFMGIYVYKKIRKILVPTLLWFIYSIILETVLMLGIVQLCVCVFFISSIVIKLCETIKKLRNK